MAYKLQDDDVALHLYRVAAGLDSLVPGEGQILGQVRSAFDSGIDRAAARPDVPRRDSCREASAAGDRDRRGSGFGRGCRCRACRAALRRSRPRAPSCCSARARRASWRRRASLRVERGSSSSPTAHPRRRVRWLRGTAARRSRSPTPRAGWRTPTWSSPRRARRSFVLTRADVEPTMRGEEGQAAVLHRHRRSAGRRSQLSTSWTAAMCTTSTISETVVSDSTPGRAGEVARAEAIVAAEAERFAAWRASRDAAPAIAALRAQAEEIRTQELERARGRLGRLTDAELERRGVDDQADRRQAPPRADAAAQGGCGRRPRRRCCFGSEPAAVGSRSRRPVWQPICCGGRAWRWRSSRSRRPVIATVASRSGRSASAASS